MRLRHAPSCLLLGDSDSATGYALDAISPAMRASFEEHVRAHLRAVPDARFEQLMAAAAPGRRERFRAWRLRFIALRIVDVRRQCREGKLDAARAEADIAQQ